MTIFYPIGWIYPNQSGGPSNSVYWLAKALTRQGIPVVICSTDKGIDNLPIDKWLDTDYGRVRYIKTKNYFLLNELITYSTRTLKNVEIVHLTALFNPLAFLVGIFALYQKKSVVWSPRGELDEQALRYSPLKKKLMLLLIKYLVSNKLFFQTTSNQETIHVKRIFGKNVKIIQIPNFLEIPKLVEKVNTIPQYLLFIGRIHPIKAIHHLIEALALSEVFTKSNVSLKIAGDDNNDYSTKLKELVAQLNLNHKVEFIGQIKEAEKEELYANAFFTFLPSHTENFGNVVVESLAQGTPVVASLGTPWQLLEEKQAGFWTDNTPPVLAMVIDKILTLSHEDYANYRANAYRLATDHFDVHKNIHQWIDAYKQVLNES